MKRYWFAIVEVEVDEVTEHIPTTADNSMRQAINRALEKMDVEHSHICNSGWGLSDYGAETLQIISVMACMNREPPSPRLKLPDGWKEVRAIVRDDDKGTP